MDIIDGGEGAQREGEGHGEMKKEPIHFPESLPPIPDGLTESARDLFVRIVNEMADARVSMQPVDHLMVSVLAIQLENFHRAELAESREEQAGETYKPISELWASAVETAKTLTLSEEALKRVLNAGQ
jgi:hypothetical protein